MSLANRLQGHFEYTEYFHLAWLWNRQMSNVLMIGLGGASTQRLFQHYYPRVAIDTAEIDPSVVEVARKYFSFKESTNQTVQVSDGRMFLRRSTKKYDAIIVDAYMKNRYGSFIPYHLATKEFFELASKQLTEQGVIAFNVIGQLQGWRADIIGALYKTMNAVFPQVYLFPARETLNVVMIATKSAEKMTAPELNRRASELFSQGRPILPNFKARMMSFRAEPPPTATSSPVLTDDYAPIDGLLNTVRR